MIDKKALEKGCFLIILLLVILLLFLWRKCSYQNFESLDFKGTIDSIWYDDKEDPTVVIKEKTYRLTFGKEELQLKDSLVKLKGSFSVKQFRNGVFIQEFVWGED